MKSIKELIGSSIISVFEHSDWYYRECADLMENDMTVILDQLTTRFAGDPGIGYKEFDIPYKRIGMIEDGDFKLAIEEVRYNRVKHQSTYVITMTFGDGWKTKLKLSKDHTGYDKKLMKERNERDYGME